MQNRMFKLLVKLQKFDNNGRALFDGKVIQKTVDLCLFILAKTLIIMEAPYQTWVYLFPCIAGFHGRKGKNLTIYFWEEEKRNVVIYRLVASIIVLATLNVDGRQAEVTDSYVAFVPFCYINTVGFIW